MRRLPVYLCIDLGKNMHSLFPIAKAEIAEILVTARTSPYALETMWMCFVAVGNTLDVVKPLCPLEEIQGVNIQPVNSMASIVGFETEVVKLFAKDLVIQNMPSQKGDWRPLILWVSDGSRPDFVKRCTNPYHWERCGHIVDFLEVRCAPENELSENVTRFVKWMALRWSDSDEERPPESYYL